MSERTVTCPRCGQQVAVPTTGEKVRCPGCGQKFRFDTQPPPLSPQPSADQPDTDTITCPRCGSTVEVPKTGEKVRCPGCGQKFRFEVKTQRSAPEPEQPPPPLPEEPPAEPETDETEDAPAQPAPALAAWPPIEPPPPTLANELRTLWPALAALVERVYQEGAASESDRVRFAEEARRAADLAPLFLPPEADPTAREFILNVLPRMTLDEVIALSFEDFRHLTEAFQDAWRLLEANIPGAPSQPAPPLPAPEPRAPAPPQPRPIISTPAVVAVVVLFGLLVVLVLNLPEVKKRLEALNPAPAKTVTIIQQTEQSPPPEPAPRPEPTPEPRADSTPTTDSTPEPAPPADTEEPPRKVEAPVFETQEPKPTPPATSTQPTASPKPTTEVVVVEKPVRVPSRWKPGPDGWIVVFRGSRPDGLDLDPANWSFAKGILIARALEGTTSAPMLEANWTDYTLEAELELGKRGQAVVAHGSLSAVLGEKSLKLLAAGRVLDELPKGLSRGKWYRVTLDVAGPKAQVRINDKPALLTTAHDGSPGPPTIGARGGAVAFRSMRVKLHPTDPDYRAVALGEGYVRPPGTAAPTARNLGPGTHKLFNGRDLSGWTLNGDWRVASGTIVGTAPRRLPATLIAGSPDWGDYVLNLRFRIVRASAVPRDEEYALVIFRARDPQNFHCVRFAVEGIYEIGYYRNGRFHETSRARFGLGSRSKFNRWHSLSLTVRGGKLTMTIDGVGGMPPWPITTFPTGAVGVGVTGGQAAFRDISVKVIR